MPALIIKAFQCQIPQLEPVFTSNFLFLRRTFKKLIVSLYYQILNSYDNATTYTPSGRIGKLVASHAAVARSIPAEVALIYTMHEELRGYCP